MGKYPDELREMLKNWADQFKDDAFTSDASQEGENQAWVITYDDAAENIDVLAERLENVLRSLKSLEPEQE